MFANNFNYNEFTKLVGIRNAIDDIFDYSMWSCYNLNLRIEIESTFLNRLRGRLSHLLKKISRYANGNIDKIDISIEILKKTDLKKIYSKYFSDVGEEFMTGYIRCKTFCNKLKEYMSCEIYDICYMEGYDKTNSREVDSEILFNLRNILNEC